MAMALEVAAVATVAVVASEPAVEEEVMVKGVEMAREPTEVAETGRAPKEQAAAAKAVQDKIRTLGNGTSYNEMRPWICCTILGKMRQQSHQMSLGQHCKAALMRCSW